MFVIGVGGNMQMGKDTLADRLAEILNKDDCKNWKVFNRDICWDRTAFAKNVKRVFADVFDVDYEFIEEWKTKDEPPPGFDMPVRKALQFIGDGFRKIKDQIWIDLRFRDQKPQIISDVRYPNEFIRVHQEGGLNILVGRPDKLNDDPNGSEALIRPYVEWYLNNTSESVVDISKLDLNEAPVDADKFNLFVRNDKDKEHFLNLVDSEIVPFVKNFVFKFDVEKE